MSQSIKPRNFALAVVIIICAILAMLVLFTPKVFNRKPEPIATPVIQPVEIAAPIQVVVLLAYTITKGDTLTKISRNTCNSIDELIDRNSIKNPDKIYAGKSLTLVKVETCSPESAKSKTFPEKFTSRTHDGASQEKLLKTLCKITNNKVTAAPQGAAVFMQVPAQSSES
jgi:LysM repeat protein